MSNNLQKSGLHARSEAGEWRSTVAVSAAAMSAQVSPVNPATTDKFETRRLLTQHSDRRPWSRSCIMHCWFPQVPITLHALKRWHCIGVNPAMSPACSNHCCHCSITFEVIQVSVLDHTMIVQALVRLCEDQYNDNLLSAQCITTWLTALTCYASAFAQCAAAQLFDCESPF